MVGCQSANQRSGVSSKSTPPCHCAGNNCAIVSNIIDLGRRCATSRYRRAERAISVSDGTPAANYLLGVRRAELIRDTSGTRQGPETVSRRGGDGQGGPLILARSGRHKTKAG